MAKTIREQIEAKKAQVAKLTQEIADLETRVGDEIDPAQIKAGAVVAFDYGKAKSRREMSGLILGVKEADINVPKSQTLVKVAVGEGFEAQIVTIYPANVKKIVKAA